MSEKLQFERAGLSRHHVRHGDAHVGWIDDRSAAVLGFPTAEEARRAAVTAYLTVVGWHGAASGNGRWPQLDRARVQAIPADERIEIDGAVVGRVFPLRRDAREPAFGFELARGGGQTFSASVHLYYRLLSVTQSSEAVHAVPPLFAVGSAEDATAYAAAAAVGDRM